jgi:hypothetical protein
VELDETVGRGVLSGAQKDLLRLRVRAPPVVDPAQGVRHPSQLGSQLLRLLSEGQRLLRLVPDLGEEPGEVVQRDHVIPVELQGAPVALF